MKKLILTIAATTAVLSFVSTTLRADNTNPAPSTTGTDGGDTQCKHGHDLNAGPQCSGSNTVSSFASFSTQS